MNEDPKVIFIKKDTELNLDPFEDGDHFTVTNDVPAYIIGEQNNALVVQLDDVPFPLYFHQPEKRR